MTQSNFFTNYTTSSLHDNVHVSSSSVEEVPTNKRPLINLTCNGLLYPSTERYEVVFNFSEPVPNKDFLASSYGTFCIGKYVYNAAKIIKTAWEKETKKLFIVFDLTNTQCRVSTRPVRFSFSIQLNDCGLFCGSNFCNCGCTNNNVFNGTFCS
jgi:hypothetical protein